MGTDGLTDSHIFSRDSGISSHSFGCSYNSPFHILFSICPYNGSSLKQWLLSNMIIALMQLSQCPPDLLENRSSLSLLPTGSSCRKSPANMIEIPPKGWFLFPMSLSFLSSVQKILSLMNDISSIMRICTSCHLFLSSRLSGLHGLMK